MAALETISEAGTQSRSDFFWRVALFLACIPSGGALLAKVLELAEMDDFVRWVTVPTTIFIVVVWYWAHRTGRKTISDALLIGFVAGLAGTFAYDLIRVPFELGGRRIFAPIFAYGMWIADADTSSRFTDITGWVYHFSNGITFGIMYALFMRGRHWMWAVVWALLLETIALTSPFGVWFSNSRTTAFVLIAYLGHVAYGLPLGFMVQYWDRSKEWLQSFPKIVRWAVVVVAIAAVVGPMFSPSAMERDARVKKNTFLVEEGRLNPDWLRAPAGTELTIENAGQTSVDVYVRGQTSDISIPANGSARFSVAEFGVKQAYIRQDVERTRSSFVIVEKP